jgi:hypothetical protein
VLAGPRVRILTSGQQQQPYRAMLPIASKTHAILLVVASFASTASSHASKGSRQLAAVPCELVPIETHRTSILNTWPNVLAGCASGRRQGWRYGLSHAGNSKSVLQCQGCSCKWRICTERSHDSAQDY